jgi:hypothetical protein
LDTTPRELSNLEGGYTPTNRVLTLLTDVVDGEGRRSYGTTSFA